MSESLDDKVRRLIAEEVAIVPYDPSWPVSFARERDHLRACLPSELVGRIEHFGSTAVPGLAASIGEEGLGVALAHDRLAVGLGLVPGDELG